MVTVYADTLVFINMFVTYFLLLATQTICRYALRRLRLLAASVFGGLYALTILLPPLPPVAAVLLRATACVLLRLTADGFRSARRFLKGLLVFLAVNCVFAGVMLLLQLLRPDRLRYSAGVVYLDVSVPFILLSTLAAFGALRLCAHLSAGRHEKALQGTLRIRMGQSTVACAAVLDTGHQLTDPFTGKPVLIVAADVLEPLVPPPVSAFLHGSPLAQCDIPPAFHGRLRLFPYETVGAQGLLPAFRCSGVRIDLEGRSYVRDEVYIAAADRRLAGGAFDALFPASVMDEMEGGEHYAGHHHPAEGMVSARASGAVRAAGSLHRHLADTAAAARKKGRS